MDIATLYARYGQPGLERLAERAGVKVSYLQRLLYRPDCRPSIQRADVLIRASAELWPDTPLTIQGLSNPQPFREARALVERLGLGVYRLRKAPRSRGEALTA